VKKLSFFVYKLILTLGACSTVIMTVGAGKEILPFSSKFSFSQFRVTSRALHRATLFSIFVLYLSPVACMQKRSKRVLASKVFSNYTYTAS